MTITEFFNRPHMIERKIEQMEMMSKQLDELACSIVKPMESDCRARSVDMHSAMSKAIDRKADLDKEIEKVREEHTEAKIRILNVIYALENEWQSEVLKKRFLERYNLVSTAIAVGFCTRYIQRLTKDGLTAAEQYINKNCPEYLSDEPICSL